MLQDNIQTTTPIGRRTQKMHIIKMERNEVICSCGYIENGLSQGKVTERALMHAARNTPSAIMKVNEPEREFDAAR